MESQHSLVLITVDCLRADHVGFLGYQGCTTPFLDSLATQSWVFQNAIVAGAPTYYSFPTILASRYPLALGRDVVGLAPGEPTLSSTLKKSGYATAGFSAANPYLSRHFGYEQGFDTFRDFLDLAPPPAAGARDARPKLRSRMNETLAKFCKLVGAARVYDDLYFEYLQRVAAPRAQSLDSVRPYPPADVVVDQARAWLAAHARSRFFLWLHLMDPHWPYYPQKKSLNLMGMDHITPFRMRYLNAYWNRGNLGVSRFGRYRDGIVNLYDACVRWVDAQVERLVGVLRQFGVWDQCVLAFTADHGEEFLEHGGHFHAPSKLTEELVHVPLLLRIPGAQARTATSLFSLIHLAPTVLESLGIAAPAGFQGRSCYAQVACGEEWDLPAIIECVAGCTNPFPPQNRMGSRLLAVREREYKLVLDFKSRGEWLFNLATDPREQAPLASGAARGPRRRLLEIARERVESSITQRDSRLRLEALLRDWRQTAAVPV